MDPFAGAAFTHLTSDSRFRCTVVGPRCLLACLRAGTPVPEMPYPLYTAAMRGLNVSFTGLQPAVKKELRVLVERMSGVYSNNFHDGVTHLVAGSVGSEKYNVAVGKEIPVMTEAWVREVWASSCSTTMVTAQEGRFATHRCPAMLGVTVCVSGMGKEDKEVLRKAVTTHGGEYSPSLEKDSTTVLITPTSSGAKYAAARRWSLPCVTSSWVFASISAGHALPYADHRVDNKAEKASTPTKQDQTVAGLAEVSMCSTILNPDETVSARVEETCNATALESGLAALVRGKATADWLQELDLARVKRAGTFLDGCKVYLSGFAEAELVQLARILKFGGAGRLTALVESVTHVVHGAGEAVAPDTARLLRSLDLSPHHVGLEWVVESMKRGRPVEEAEYPFPPRAQGRTEEPMAPPSSPPRPPARDETATFEAGLLAQYGKGQTSTMLTETMSQVVPFLSGLTFHLIGFPETQQQDLSDWITEAQGELVYSDHTDPVDYLLVPVAGVAGELRPHRRLVTEIWLEDCLDEGRLISPPLYYHRALALGAARPLEGVVTCLSGYSGRERDFLNQLVVGLGGVAQEIFAKRDNPEKGARGNTHLVCPEPEGNKYEAAVKWKLPIVTREWLRACWRDLAWVSEGSFLVGASTTVTRGRPEPSEEPMEVEESRQEDTVTDQSVGLVNRSYQRAAGTPKAAATLAAKSPRAAPVTPLAALSMASPRGPRPVETPDTVVRPASRLATPGAADSPLATQLLRPKPINLTDITVTPQRWADSQPSPHVSGGKRKRVAEGGGEDMPTPKTPYGCHFTPNPSPATRKYYKQLAARMPTQQLTDLERKQMEQFSKFKPGDVGGPGEEVERQEEGERQHEEAMDLLESRGLPVLERDSRPFEDIMEERYQQQGKSWKTFSQDAAARARARMEEMEREEGAEGGGEGGGSRVLEGVGVCVGRKLAAAGRAAEVHRVVEELGGAVAWQLTPAVTHLVFLGAAADRTKEFRQARDAGQQVVAPDWVFMCRDEGRRVEEELFPHTFNPRMKLDLTSQSPPLSQAGSARAPRRPAQPRLAQLSQVQASQLEVTEMLTKEEEVPEEVTADLAEMANLLDSASKTPVPASGRKVLKAKLSNQEETRRSVGAEVAVEEEQAKESQVLWVDPEEVEQRRKLTDQVNALETQDLHGMETMETMGSINMTEVMDGENKENKRRGADFVFMVSGLGEEVGMEEAVARLGGRLSAVPAHFDPESTHMVTSKVSRSEKTMSAVASGRWLLHPSYVAESLARGRWLEEERFEWGNSLNGFHPSGAGGTEARLAAAARRWRLQGLGCEAFAGMVLVLLMPSNKREQFRRLVEAGGGRVTEARQPYSNTAGLTHLLTETKYIGKEKVGGLY